MLECDDYTIKPSREFVEAIRKEKARVQDVIHNMSDEELDHASYSYHMYSVILSGMASGSVGRTLNEGIGKTFLELIRMTVATEQHYRGKQLG